LGEWDNSVVVPTSSYDFEVLFDKVTSSILLWLYSGLLPVP